MWDQKIDIQDYPFLKLIASWLNQKTIQQPKFMSDETLDKARELRKIAQ